MTQRKGGLSRHVGRSRNHRQKIKSHASDTYDKRREQNHNKKAYELSLALASERKASLRQ